jgi:outer membrane receptor protein involved in Fe transport
MWKFSGGYVFNRARVTENDKTPALIGKDLPQVPRHRGTVQVTYSHPRFLTASVEVLAMSRQFDDDLNTRSVPGISTPGLPPYGVMSLALSRNLGSRINLFFGVQNIFDQEFFVGTLPTTVGAPRMVSGGLRIQIGRIH